MVSKEFFVISTNSFNQNLLNAGAVDLGEPPVFRKLYLFHQNINHKYCLLLKDWRNLLPKYPSKIVWWKIDNRNRANILPNSVISSTRNRCQFHPHLCSEINSFFKVQEKTLWIHFKCILLHSRSLIFFEKNVLKKICCLQKVFME